MVPLIAAIVQFFAYLLYYRDDLKAWRKERQKQMGNHFCMPLFTPESA